MSAGFNSVCGIGVLAACFCVPGLVNAEETLSIHGCITDQSTGSPVENAHVMLRYGEQSAGSGGMAYEWTQIGKISTGVDGNYSFTELSSSPDEGHPYQVLVYHDLYNTEKSDNIVLDTDFEIDFALTEKTFGGMQIIVTAASGSAPLAGVTISAGLQVNQGELYTGVTDADGKLSFTDVVVGTYRVTAYLAGYEVTTADALVEEGITETVQMPLAVFTDESKTLTGTVVDSDGNPVTGKIVVIKFGGQSERVQLADSTDNAGAFTIEGIPATYTSGKVEVEADEYFSIDTIITLSTATSTIDIVLTLKTTALIGAGHVVAMKNAISVAGNQSQNGSLVVTGITKAYQVSVYALDGRVLYRGMVSPGNAIVPLKSASRGIILRLHNGADNAVEHRFLNRMH